MKTLFLIRHAKSSWDDPSMADYDRPLNERGKRNAPFMGKILAKAEGKPDLMVSSTAKRAMSTAKRIAKELKYEEEKIKGRKELYLADIPTWLTAVNALPNKADTVMMFGHNEGITNFANYLTGAHIENIPTCGMVKIRFDFDNWERVSKGNGDLVYFDFPKRYSENLE